MNPPHQRLEVLETRLAFHGGPEGPPRRRTVHIDDIEHVDGHPAHSRGGWYPVCTLTLYGGERITIALDASRRRAEARKRANELADAYRHYLPAQDPDIIDGVEALENGVDDSLVDITSTRLSIVCASCASLNTIKLLPKGPS